MFHSKQDVDRHVNEVFRNIRSEYQRNVKCYQIAKLYYKFKDYKSAIKYINRYILTSTNSAAAHKLLGECYLGINLKAKALDSFKTSLELNGNQHDLVLKVCTLLMDPEVSAVTPRATYWLERAESLFPSNPVVFRLREYLLKSNLDGKHDNEQLEKLILSEISARPADVSVRIRLLNFFVDTKRYKIAYQHALEIESRRTFSSDLRWYDCLCNLVQAYEKANLDVGFSFFIQKIYFFERRADLFMQEFQDEVKTLPECSSALFAFDQSLHTMSKIEVPKEEAYFFAEFMKHMRAQLSFHLATLALKRAKKEYGIWPKAFRVAAPLLLQATQNTMNLEEAWCNMWPGKNKMEKEVELWNKSATFRISQAGHVLLAWAQNKGPKFLEKVSQFCGGKWQAHVYQDIFYNREHQQATATSHFINDPFFSSVPMRLLSETELSHFDKVSQSAYPDSLHHLVWLGLAYCSSNGQLNHDFRCMTVPDLQFTVENLTQCGPETLNQLDVDAFLYASVLCAKMTVTNVVSSDRPSRLPVSISEDLCSAAQADWWVAVYRTYKNLTSGNIADMRLKLRKGIETIRAFGQHGLHVKLLVMLAKLFQDRATKTKNPNEVTGLEERAYLYWTAAIPILEKVEKSQQLREVPNRLFDYRGKDLTLTEIKGHLEDGRLFLGCRLMKKGRHEQAIEAFQSLKSPYATFYQALIYEKLASEEVNHRSESITSENRSQHIILLTRARDALYLTLDRLRCPAVDPNHPLNSQLQDHLEEIEKQLAMIDPDSTLNRNGDSESDETDTAPGPLSPPHIDENLDTSVSIFNTSNFLNTKNHSASRGSRQNFSSKYQQTRFEARPSPERLDAQLRHLVQANSNGLQAIVEQLKEMKSTMQIELKDLGCVTRDLLAEMKRWNDKLESVSKRATDSLKPEDLFELREEDYEDFSQLSQQYPPYQNYQINRQMIGTQAPSSVTYGAPVPTSPIPPAPAVVPPTENPLIPPSFYPPSLYPPAHTVPPVDPSLLLYQSLGSYTQGLPYGENQNPSDYRGAGILKGAPFAKNAYRAPDVSVPVTKPQPPNVVITSSDTIPAFTSAGTPAMSVTIPPQHIRGLTPTVPQKQNPNQVHPFQIPLPPQAQLVKESPSEKLNAIIPSSSVSTSPVQTSNVSGIKPLVQQTTPPQEVMSSLVEKGKLFEARGKLSVLADKEWKDQGKVLAKILHEEKLGKVRITLYQEQLLKVLAEHYITPDMALEPAQNGDNGWIWTANNVSKNDSQAWGSSKCQKFCLQFLVYDEAKDFEFAFNEGLKIAKRNTESNANTVQKTKSPIDLSEKKGKACSVCKTKVENGADKCSACEDKGKANEKTSFGGFTFMSSPILKPPFLNLNKEQEKPKETVKPSPFAEFSFPVTATTTSQVTDSRPASNTTPKGPFASENSGDSLTSLWSVKADPNSFKKDANFKGFEGKNSLVFGYLNKPAKPASTPEKASSTAKSTKEGEDEEGDGEDFVPTAEFTPVVDLPDLVDVKTGEENDKVLFSERAKLLRFDTELKEWKERGVGKMNLLLNEESGKVRLIMRRELVLKVCCNHYLDETMEFKPLTKSEKALTWYAQDYSEGDLKPDLFALRFQTRDIMLKFLHVLKDTQGKMKNGRMEGTKSKEPKDDKSSALKPLSELFKPKAGSWECGACFVRNTETSEKCISCETSKPGTEKDAKDSKPQTTGLGKGISIPATTKFTFGIPQPASNSTPTTTSSASSSEVKFTFGTPQSTTSTSLSTSSTYFTFGIPQASTNATSSGSMVSSSNQFSFGTPPLSSASFPSTKINWNSSRSSSTPVSTSASTPTFSFQVPQMSSSSTNPIQVSGSSFSFGTTQTTTTSISLSSPKFTFSIPNVNSSSGKDNIKNIFGGFSAKKPEGEQQTPLSFNIPKAEAEKGETSSSFNFASLKPEGKEKFEFSLSNLKPEIVQEGSKTSSSPKGKGSEDKTGSEDSEEEAEDDSRDDIVVKPIVPLPDMVAVHTGEEDEVVLYEHRAKLFRFFNKEWRERGIGDVKILKHKTNNKLRLLMRRETILKVCLNHYLTPEIDFKPKDEKTWNWTAPDFSEGEVEYQAFAIRFKTPEIANEFMKAVKDAMKNNVVRSPLKNEAKVKEPTSVMKNFTFAVPNTPKSSASSEPSKVIQPEASDDDVLIVYETKVTPEQREKAMSLHLPPNFYAYLQVPDCPGCPGCDKDDASLSIQQSPPPNKPATKLNAQPLFANTSWGTLNFGKGDDAGNKVLFSFAGNQTTTEPKSLPNNSNVNEDADCNEEEEDEGGDEGEEEEDNENDEDENYEVEEEEEENYEDEEEEDNENDEDKNEDEENEMDSEELEEEEKEDDEYDENERESE